MSEAWPDSGWERRRLTLSGRYERVGLECLAARGFRSVTMDDIAGAAGVSARTLFRYFPSKEDILLAVPRRGVAMSVSTIESLEPSDQPLLAAWRALCDSFWGVSVDVEMLTLWRRAAVEAPEVHARVRGERMEAHLDALSDYMARSLGGGVKNEVRNRLYAGLLTGAEAGLIELWGRSRLSRKQLFAAAEEAFRRIDLTLHVS
jgi:AcrR family transcriptional regulator